MSTPSPHLPPDCARFEDTLGSWLERETDGPTTAWMNAHRDACPQCAALVADLEQLVTDAAALPPIAPPRDLWADIEARLDAPVIPISRGFSSAATQPAAPPLTFAAPESRSIGARPFSVRTLAIAATLLVAVSSGVTWQLTRPTPPLVDPSRVAVNATETFADTADAPEMVMAADSDSNTARNTGTFTRPNGAAERASVRLVADDALPDFDMTYEREISSLRQIVDERFAELDTSTVNELRRNLDIIDRAIADSKAALARDPRSALLSSQLDRALEAKLQLLRRVALL